MLVGVFVGVSVTVGVTVDGLTVDAGAIDVGTVDAGTTVDVGAVFPQIVVLFVAATVVFNCIKYACGETFMLW